MSWVSHLAMSLYVQGLPTEHCMCWYFAALDVKYRLDLIRSRSAMQTKETCTTPPDLQHFGYQSSSSTRIRPGSLVGVAKERCLAE